MNTVTAATCALACSSDVCRDVQLLCPPCGSLACQKNLDLYSLLHVWSFGLFRHKGSETGPAQGAGSRFVADHS